MNKPIAFTKYESEGKGDSSLFVSYGCGINIINVEHFPNRSANGVNYYVENLSYPAGLSYGVYRASGWPDNVNYAAHRLLLLNKSLLAVRKINLKRVDTREIFRAPR